MQWSSGLYGKKYASPAWQRVTCRLWLAELTAEFAEVEVQQDGISPAPAFVVPKCSLVTSLFAARESGGPKA